MLNPFPIQFLSYLAYFLLRLFVAGTLIYLGVEHYKHRHKLKHILKLPWFPFGGFVSVVFPLGELVVGAFMFVGAFVQYAALAVIVMSLKMIFMRQWFDHHSIPPKIFYVLLLGAAISLFITGAGILAFDLPI